MFKKIKKIIKTSINIFKNTKTLFKLFLLSLVVLVLIPPINNYRTQKSIFDKNGIQYIKLSGIEKNYVVEDDVIDLSYKEFDNNKNIYNTVFMNASGENFYTLSNIDNKYYKVAHPQYEDFRKDLLDEGVIVKNINDICFSKNVGDSKMVLVWFCVIVSICLLCCIISETVKQAKLYNNPLKIRSFIFKENANNIITKMSFDSSGSTMTKSKIPFKKHQEKDGIKVQTEAKEEDNKLITFDDVIGLEEVKKDICSLVDFINNREKYQNAGAKLPKGVIFYGSPGTGKTLLAKALANEAGIPFLYRSGTDFIEQYVGVGAKRIRELFHEARRKAPCVVFIDEIDAIGKTRKGDENGEDRKTTNALLTEMDGFNELDNVLVIGATNRLEDLDAALTREGRFTDKFCIPLPANAEEREKILKFYAKNKKLSDDVSLSNLAKECVGYSPAGLEALLNEAAIISVQDKKEFITKDHIEKAVYKSMLNGHAKEKNQKNREKEELELVSWHEAGHALIAKLNGEDVSKVTIVSSTSGAGGVTFSTPAKEHLLSVEDLRQQVIKLYGGRVAELMLYGNKSKITTGASNDIERATRIIHEIVTKYGMDEEYGLLNLNLLKLDTKVIIDREVKLAKELEKETEKILKENYSLLKILAENLLEHETLYNDDIDRICKIC